MHGFGHLVQRLGPSVSAKPGVAALDLVNAHETRNLHHRNLYWCDPVFHCHLEEPLVVDVFAMGKDFGELRKITDLQQSRFHPIHCEV